MKFNFQCKPRIVHHAAANHDVIAASDFTATNGVGHSPDFAIGHHRQFHTLTKVGNAIPISRRPVAMRLGAGVHHQLICASCLNGLGAIFRTQIVVKAQTHFGGYRHIAWHSTAHGSHNLTHQFWLIKKHRTPTMTIDRFGRATKVQIYASRIELGQARRIGCQNFGVGAQQLSSNWHSRMRFTFIQQLWHHPVERSFWKHRIGHSNKFRHTQINAARTSERVTQAVVQQPFHGGQQNFHLRQCFKPRNASFELLPL